MGFIAQKTSAVQWFSELQSTSGMPQGCTGERLVCDTLKRLSHTSSVSSGTSWTPLSLVRAIIMTRKITGLTRCRALLMFIYIIFNVLFLEKKGVMREASICCSTYLCIDLCIDWLILVCALIGIEPATLAYQDDAPTNRATRLGLKLILMLGRTRASRSGGSYYMLSLLNVKMYFAETAVTRWGNQPDKCSQLQRRNQHVINQIVCLCNG